MRLSVQTLLFFCFIFVNSMVNGRKYDLEKECMKLYGEDIPTVLQSFRRTPEYLSILDKEKDEVLEQSYSVLKAIHRYFEAKLEQKIKEVINYTKESEESVIRITTSEPISSVLRAHNGPNGSMKKLYRDSSRRRMFQRPRSYRRQEPDPDNPETKTEKPTSSTIDPKTLLDNYEKFNSFFTLAERNQMKDIGFEFAIDMIRAVIKHVGGETDDSGGGGGKEESSTKLDGIQPTDSPTTTSTTQSGPEGQETTTEEPELGPGGFK